jgi:hypothetical protein
MTAAAHKILVSLAGIAASAALFSFANTGRYIGKSISVFFPCTDSPGTSFPCYGIIDIWVMVLALLTGLTFFISILVTTYHLLSQ